MTPQQHGNPMFNKQENFFAIRFRDPERLNEEATDVWSAYYCEGTLADHLEAAEIYDAEGLAVHAARLMQEASGNSLGHFADSDYEVLLKLRILGLYTQPIDLSGLKLEFRQKVVIEVIEVEETQEGWMTKVVWNERYQWVFDPESDGLADEDDEEHDEDEEGAREEEHVAAMANEPIFPVTKEEPMHFGNMAWQAEPKRGFFAWLRKLFGR
jgi:hypothetical protein